MLDLPADQFLGGWFLIIAGIAIIIFHDQIRKFHDSWQERDLILRQGDWWTGRYSRGGLLITRAAIIIFGIVFLIGGVQILFF
jgi:hypothetical protein